MQRTVISSSLIIILCNSLLPQSVFGVPALIDFEDQQANSVLTSAYERTAGVRFNALTVGDYSNQRPGFTPSGIKGIQPCSASDEFCSKQFIIDFANAQSVVSVKAGYLMRLEQARTLFMRAFDANGQEVASSSQIIPASEEGHNVDISLEVRSSTGNQVIKQVRIGFEPQNLSNLFVILDDLEFDNAGGSFVCTSSAAPTISIDSRLSPITTSVNRFVLTGNVITDSPLVSANLVISNSTNQQSINILNRGVPDSSGPFVLAMDGMLFSGTNSLSITVSNCRGSDVEGRTAEFSPIAVGTSIHFLGMEVTQSVQTLENSVRLIQQRPTVVRVYLGLEGPSSSVGNVSGYLYAYKPLPVEGGFFNPFRTGDPLSFFRNSLGGRVYALPSLNEVTVKSGIDVKALRADSTLSINFVLPTTWTMEERIHFGFKPIIDGMSAPIPCVDDRIYAKALGCNNYLPEALPDIEKTPRIAYYQFEKGYPMYVGLVGVPYNTLTGVVKLGAQSMSNIASWLVRAFPAQVADYYYNTLKNPFSGQPSCEDVNSYLEEAGFLYFFSGKQVLETTDQTGLDKLWDGRRIAAIVPNLSTGCNSEGSLVSTASESLSHVGHEIAHSYGYDHHGFENNGAGCLVSYQDGSDIDMGFPYAFGSIGEYWRGRDVYFPLFFTDPNVGPYVGAYGFDVGKGKSQNSFFVYDPAVFEDLMSYCDREWVSPYLYHNMMSTFRDHHQARTGMQSPGLTIFGPPDMEENIRRLPPSDGVMLVTGSLHIDNGVLDLKPIITIPTRIALNITSQSEFSVFTRSANGSVLNTYPIRLMNMTDTPDRSGTKFFAQVLPLDNSTNELVFAYNGTEVKSVKASTSPPEIELVFPNGGEIPSSGEMTIQWEASDVDGNNLTYAVLYSDNDGQTWTLLDTFLEQKSYTVNATDLPGSGEARVRVMVTDGFFTSFDDSNNIFTVPDKIPQVTLVAPENNSEFTTSDAVTLDGSGFDIEDGVLDQEAFEWTSSLDGTLGTGRSNTTAELSPGTHNITLIARDSKGQVGSESVIVKIVSEFPHANVNYDAWVTVGENATIDSTDSSGVGQLSYQWALVGKPEGSAAELGSVDSNKTSLIPDLPGSYELQLSILDAAGNAAFTHAIVNAIAPDSLFNFSVSSTIDEKQYTVYGRQRNVEVNSFTVRPEGDAIILHLEGRTGGLLEINIPRDLADEIITAINPESGSELPLTVISSATSTRLMTTLQEDANELVILASVVAQAKGPPDCNNATIIGNDNGNDVIQGTSGNDIIIGLGGNDIINGNDGNDEICGGNGNDIINSGAGNDLIDAGPNNDVGNGGPGQDTCFNLEFASSCEA